MNVLLDSCVWGGVRAELAAAGHDVVWTGDWPEDPGDEEILARAYGEGRILVTLDKDFGELAVVFGHAHSGIVRIVNFQISNHASVCLNAIERHGEELAKEQSSPRNLEDCVSDRPNPI